MENCELITEVYWAGHTIPLQALAHNQLLPSPGILRRRPPDTSGEVIGRGSFGIIRKVQRREDGRYFARKELSFDKMTQADRRQICAEVNILKNLQHQNIVRYIERCVDPDSQ